MIKYLPVPLLIFYLLAPVLACAVDFKMQGQWVMSFGYGANGRFEGSYNGHSVAGWGKGQDNFETSQRFQFHLYATLSQILAGTVSFEAGESWWGQVQSAAALGADKSNFIKLSNAFFDWNLPKAGIRARMGLQGISTPAFASGNSVLNATLVGVVANWDDRSIFSPTFFWGRPYNDNYPGWQFHGFGNYHAGFMDNVDVFGLVTLFSGSGFRIAPWFMFSMIGPNAFRGRLELLAIHLAMSAMLDLVQTCLGLPCFQLAGQGMKIFQMLKIAAI